MVGGGADTTGAVRARVARGRPNWWVILAVSLALMALLVATAGGSRRAVPSPHAGAQAANASRTSAGSAPRKPATAGARDAPSSPAAVSTTTTLGTPTGALTPGGGGGPATSSAAAPTGTASSPQAAPATSAVPAAAPTSTTTTTAPSAVPADRTQTQGYLDPPLQTSNRYAFTGTGAMEVSVLWSGSTYLTMTVSCPSGSQSVGGTSAMAATLPDARGSCLATVSEPAPEAVALTYTVSIGPAGG